MIYAGIFLFIHLLNRCISLCASFPFAIIAGTVRTIRDTVSGSKVRNGAVFIMISIHTGRHIQLVMTDGINLPTYTGMIRCSTKCRVSDSIIPYHTA